MTFSRFFSEQARKPSGVFGRWVMSRIFERGNVVVNDLLKEGLDLRPDDRILEIGCGTGKLIADISGSVANGFIEGIDFSETMVELAEKKNSRAIADGRVKIRQGDFGNTPYEAAGFDKVCSANTVYFWRQPERFVQKIRAILKPGGRLALSFENGEQLRKKPLATEVFRFYGTDDIRKLLEDNGFSGNVDILTRESGASKYHCAVAVKPL